MLELVKNNEVPETVFATALGPVYFNVLLR